MNISSAAWLAMNVPGLFEHWHAIAFTVPERWDFEFSHEPVWGHDTATFQAIGETICHPLPSEAK